MTFDIAKMPGETRPHGRKVLWNRTVHAQFGPVARRVEIAAGGDHQAELAGQDRQGTDLFGRLHAIDHLDGVSAGLEKVGDQAPALGPGEIIMIRVRQADPGARLAQAADHFLQGRPVLLDVSQLAGPSHLRNASARSLTQPPWTRNSAKCGRAGALPLSPRARWIARAPSSAPGIPLAASRRSISSARAQRPRCRASVAWRRERRRGRNRSPAHEWWHRPRCRTARYR